jgi:aspartate dehydrogenase
MVSISRKLKIGVVGCGTIGSYLARIIHNELKDKALLIAVYDKVLEKAYTLASSLKNKKIVVVTLEELIERSDLVIEAASGAAASQVARSAISFGRDCLVMSVGGLLEAHKELFNLAREKKRHLYLPSGAIAGIDGIKSLAATKIHKITISSYKPPRAFIGIPYLLKRNINLEKIKEDTVLFEGDVATSVRLFPQNINVAATLSLAAHAKDKLSVKIIASPSCKNNIHQIEVEAEAGKLTVRTENVPSPNNPKTSFLAVLSAVTTIKGILDFVKIGT